MDLTEENIFLNNLEFTPLNDFQVQNIHNYFNNEKFSLKSDLEEINSTYKINAEIITFNNENLNEFNEPKRINGLRDLYNENRLEDKYLRDKNYYESVQMKIKENVLSKKPFKEKKILGRKKKCEKILGEHNKYSDDNLIRKCKNIILASAFNFINEKIMHLYSEKIQKFQIKKLLKLKQNQSIKSRSSYNKNFLKATLKTIFSEDVSSKYSKYSRTHNKILIESLINEEDNIKREIFINIFNLTFTDCLHHFRGSDFCNELEGMMGINEYINEKNTNNKDEEYYKCFKYIINNYEKIIMEKKERKYRKKKK